MLFKVKLGSYEHWGVKKRNGYYKKHLIIIAIIAKLKIAIMKLRSFFSKEFWKTKAIMRARDVKSLKKRNKELIKSRDKAKIKNTSLRIKNKELRDKVRELKNELKKN